MSSVRNLPLVTVIGVGSPFATDSLGWQAIDYLRQSRFVENLPVTMRFEQLDRPGPGLLAAMRDTGMAVVIDAVVSPDPGVFRLTLDELLQQDMAISSHSFGVAETLALGSTLHELPDELWIYGIPMGSTGDAWKSELLQLVATDLAEFTGRSLGTQI